MTAIDGQDVRYLTRYGLGFQDLDALYNKVSFSPIYNADSGSLNHTGTFRGPAIAQTDITSLTFANGTTSNVGITAELVHSAAQDLPHNSTGYYKYLKPTTTASSPGSSTETPKHSNLPLGPAYPSPIVKHDFNFIQGFFLNETENSDVAVLSVPSFFALGESNITEFTMTADKFLKKSRSAGKRRLIVDIRNNGGGDVDLGYNLFQLLFPKIVAYSGVRLRYSDAANMLGSIESSAIESLEKESSSNNASAIENTRIASAILAAHPNLYKQRFLQQNDGSNWTSWQQFFGPVAQHGDLFSNVAAQADFSTADASTELASQLKENSLPAQVFASENITLVSDFL